MLLQPWIITKVLIRANWGLIWWDWLILIWPGKRNTTIISVRIWVFCRERWMCVSIIMFRRPKGRSLRWRLRLLWDFLLTWPIWVKWKTKVGKCTWTAGFGEIRQAGVMWIFMRRRLPIKISSRKYLIHWKHWTIARMKSTTRLLLPRYLSVTKKASRWVRSG